MIRMTVAGPKRTLSTRARLMILAVIAVVPLLLNRINDEEASRAERIEVAYKQALRLAQEASFRKPADRLLTADPKPIAPAAHQINGRRRWVTMSSPAIRASAARSTISKVRSFQRTALLA